MIESKDKARKILVNLKINKAKNIESIQ